MLIDGDCFNNEVPGSPGCIQNVVTNASNAYVDSFSYCALSHTLAAGSHKFVLEVINPTTQFTMGISLNNQFEVHEVK
jgi:hypothetical protein